MNGLAALMALGLAQAAQPAPTTPTAPTPVPPASAPTAAQATLPQPAPERDPSSGLPAGPRPYTELPASPAPRATTSGVDYPALPQSGMGGEAWGERVRERSQAAQGRQGSLDGGWTVTGAHGAALYVVQLVDAPGRELEGVWRESPRPGVLPVSGLFASAGRQGAQTVLSFEAPRSGGTANLLLTPAAGGWTGNLTVGGQARPVRLVRNATP